MRVPMQASFYSSPVITWRKPWEKFGSKITLLLVESLKSPLDKELIRNWMLWWKSTKFTVKRTGAVSWFSQLLGVRLVRVMISLIIWQEQQSSLACHSLMSRTQRLFWSQNTTSRTANNSSGNSTTQSERSTSPSGGSLDTLMILVVYFC